MDNLLEILVPLIFAAVYFFGNMLSRSGGDERPSARSRRPGLPVDEEAAERQRRIQEEIRRKIMERRREAEGVAPTVTLPPNSAKLRERRREVEARREVREHRKETREVVHEAEAPSYLAPTYETEPQEAEAPRGFSWDTSDDIYQETMQAQLRQIEATKRQAEALKRQAEAGRSAKSAARRGAHAKSSGGPVLSGSVRDQLKNPAAARAAFVYGEVLGQPVGMRKGSRVPGLS